MPHIRVDRLVGRKVRGPDNRSIGRLEEFRAERTGDDWVVTDYVIGPAGLLERLGLGAGLVLGWKRSGLLARWNQIDLSDPDRPRLLCPVSDLRRF